MSSHADRPNGLPHGSVTVATTFVFVGLFRLEQNVAYVLGLPSTRELVELDIVPIGPFVHALAPFIHATPDHLISTLFWFIPFGYLLERRTSWIAYVGFVVVAGYMTTTFVPLLFVVAGNPVGPGIGASGITNAVIAREAAVRGEWLVQRQALSRRQWTVVALVGVVFLIKVVGLVTGEPTGTSVVGHVTGLVVGALVGVGEGYVSLVDE